MLFLFMGERRELNPRMVDSQSTALIHLATSAPLLYIYLVLSIFLPQHKKEHIISFLFIKSK